MQLTWMRMSPNYLLVRQLSCRLSFGMSADGEVAMKVVSRGDSEAVSEMVHAIIQEA